MAEVISRKTKRLIVIVLDSVGIGELPDANEYGDKGSNTLKNIALAVGGLNLPQLESCGLGLVEEIKGIKKIDNPIASYGKMAERSKGKDTTTGHWEMMGIITEKPFPVYPHGFPTEIIEKFEKAIGRKTLGNFPASGTEIIKQLGEEHLKTGYPIVYTSGDSVFQIACHENIIPLEELYNYCRKAREILTEPHHVGRVIARPFKGEPGAFFRTPFRHDFSLNPTHETVLDILCHQQIEVIGIGKIWDIFNGKGVTTSLPTKNNQESIEKIKQVLTTSKQGLIFVNLVDFDMLYGHRNDPTGYAQALKEFDNGLAGIISLLNPDDYLIITADHGCDPTTTSTDHSREYVPLLFYNSQIKPGRNLGTRQSFADLGATILKLFGINEPVKGKDFILSSL